MTESGFSKIRLRGVAFFVTVVFFSLLLVSPSSEAKPMPVFSFWDSGKNGLAHYPIQQGNVENQLNLSDSSKFQKRLVHINAEAYDENFLFELVSRSYYQPEFFQIENLTDEIREIVQEKYSQSLEPLAVISKANPVQFPFEQIKKRYLDALVFRGYIASKMTKADLVQKSVLLANSPMAQIEFKRKKFSAAEMFQKAAVPMSDFVRLALLSEYGGLWLDSTITINTDLEVFTQLLKEKGKSLLMFYNPFYAQDDRVFKGQGNAGASETWWLMTLCPQEKLLLRWLALSNEYWLRKTPGQHITQHPLFTDDLGRSINVGKILDPLQNYLWIYLLWSRTVLEMTKGVSDRVLALDAFQGGKELGPGPLAFLEKHLFLPGAIYYLSALPESFFGVYTAQIDAFPLIKIPGQSTQPLVEKFKKKGGIHNSPNIFKHIWSKNRKSGQ